MTVRTVHSKDNSRVKQLRRALADPPRPTRLDAPVPASSSETLIGVEGPNLIAETLHAGLRIACVFVAEGHESLLDEFNLAAETEILAVPRSLLDSVLVTETPQPIAALVEAPHWGWGDILGHEKNQAPLIVVLAGLQDPGNLGTIVRSAEAFGAHGILALTGTVNAWNPKAVRASAGSVFRLPFLAAETDQCFRHLREAGVKAWSTAVSGATPANFADLAGPVALVIGNEGNGVPTEVAALADSVLTIPCPGPVESLNASVAASVLLYEAARQRSAAGKRPKARGGAA